MSEFQAKLLPVAEQFQQTAEKKALGGTKNYMSRMQRTGQCAIAIASLSCDRNGVISCIATGTQAGRSE